MLLHFYKCYYTSRISSLFLQGMWIGMIVGVGMQTLALIYITWRTKWDTEVKIIIAECLEYA